MKAEPSAETEPLGWAGPVHPSPAQAQWDIQGRVPGRQVPPSSASLAQEGAR